jgi:glycosyltransferase involved in cell wall biosynthesis
MTPPWNIVFWQSILSPHQKDLLAAVGRDPRFNLTRVVVRDMGPERLAQGWEPIPDNVGIAHIDPSAETVETLCNDVTRIHVHQGLKPLGFEQCPLRFLRTLRAPFLCAVERPEIEGLASVLRKLKHRIEARRLGSNLQILSAGHGARPWFASVLGDPSRVFDYAYFLDPQPSKVNDPHPSFEIVYAGQLIRRKRVDLLISAVATMADLQWRLKIVGDGPMRSALERQARVSKVADRIVFTGGQRRAHVLEHLGEADVAVLPSDHDGWGALIEEAMGVGVPVIASDGCGASSLITSDDIGQVFARGDTAALTRALDHVSTRVRRGAYDPAIILGYAHRTSGQAGADYLAQLVAHLFNQEPRPNPAWLAGTALGDKT